MSYHSADGKLPNKIRVIGQDKAGNFATQIVALATPASPPQAAAAPTPVAAAPPAPPPVKAESNIVAPVPQAAAPVPVPAVAANTTEARMTEKPAVPVTEKPVAPVAEKPAAPATEQLPPVASGTRQTINSNHCTLNYALDNLGTQSIQKVEAYATKDNGKTWQHVAGDTSKASAIELTFAEDGLYGVMLVVSTAAQPGTLPTEADQADWWIEVDTVGPEVRLESATPGVNDDAGLLMLSWSVKDKNLAPDSVELSWSTTHEGPWRSIAKGLRSDNQYRWAVPREAAGKCFLKIEATDRAGNVGRFVSPQAVATEQPKPRARMLGINPSAARQ